MASQLSIHVLWGRMATWPATQAHQSPLPPATAKMFAGAGAPALYRPYPEQIFAERHVDMWYDVMLGVHTHALAPVVGWQAVNNGNVYVLFDADNHPQLKSHQYAYISFVNPVLTSKKPAPGHAFRVLLPHVTIAGSGGGITADPLGDILNTLHDPPPRLQKQDYPHRCPSCGGAAYVGFTKVDCFAKCKGAP